MKHSTDEAIIRAAEERMAKKLKAFHDLFDKKESVSPGANAIMTTSSQN
jgi:hypothetical protein